MITSRHVCMDANGENENCSFPYTDWKWKQAFYIDSWCSCPIHWWLMGEGPLILIVSGGGTLALLTSGKMHPLPYFVDQWKN